MALELLKAVQASSHGREPASNSPHAQQEPLSPSQYTGLPDALREQPPRCAEPSQGYDSSEGSEVPATGPVILDSEEQEAMQLTRPGSGAQRPLSLPDSEDPELETQPQRAESPGQHVEEILDSEDHNRLDQPAEASLPEPSAAVEGSDQAAKGCKRPASEATADGAASHEQETAQVQAQSEAEFEASIAHLSVKAQREVRALHNLWDGDKCVTPPKPVCAVSLFLLQNGTALHLDPGCKLTNL